MELDIEVRGNDLVVRVAGELDLQAAGEFRRRIEAELDRAQIRTVYVDLARVTFIDSSGLGALLGRWRRIRQEGGRMVLVAPAPAVRPVLELAGIYRLMEVRDRIPGTVA